MSCRALIIEDDPESRYLMRYLLQGVGCQVEEASDGEAGLVAIRADTPDLILLDIGLPGMDGFEVLNSLRQIPDGAKIPVVVVTAHLTADERAELERNGVSFFVEKPIDPPALLKHIRALLGLSCCKGT